MKKRSSSEEELLCIYSLAAPCRPEDPPTAGRWHPPAGYSAASGINGSGWGLTMMLSTMNLVKPRQGSAPKYSL